MERTMGWRHFRAIELRKDAKDAFVLLVATCDESVRLWVNMKNLKNRAAWAAGWLQKTELLALEGLGGGGECRKCGGSGALLCPLCSRAGEVVEL